MWTFESPLYLLFFVFFPFLIYFVHFRKNRGGVIPFPFFPYRRSPSKLTWSMWWKRGLTLVLFIRTLLWLAFALLLLALAGPNYSQSQNYYAQRGLDVVFVLDQSPSMGIHDFGSRTRFDYARTFLLSFVERALNDHFALVSFASHVILRVPLTPYRDFFQNELEDLYLLDLGEGTALGKSLDVALLHLAYSKAQGKIIVLITDGVNSEGPFNPREISAWARSLGIKIYTLGLGSEGTLPLDFQDRQGNRYQGFVEQSFDPRPLEELAESTGGFYYSIETSSAFYLAFESLYTRESGEKILQIQVKNTSYTHRVLFFVLFLFLFYFFLKFFWLNEVL